MRSEGDKLELGCYASNKFALKRPSFYSLIILLMMGSYPYIQHTELS
jgi:hypothetical protein